MCLSFLEMCLHIVYLENAFVSHESDGLVVSMILERLMSQSSFHTDLTEIRAGSPRFTASPGRKWKFGVGANPTTTMVASKQKSKQKWNQNSWVTRAIRALEPQPSQEQRARAEVVSGVERECAVCWAGSSCYGICTVFAIDEKSKCVSPARPVQFL